MQNPLLINDKLPNFDQITAKHFEPAIDELTGSYRMLVEEVTRIAEPTWENTVQKLDEASVRLEFAYYIIEHLNAVQNTEDIRQAYELVLPKITNFSTDLSQNKDLYKLYKKLHDSGAFDFYNVGQRSTIEHALRSFKLAGVDLPQEQKQELKKINEQISELSNKFEKNLIDSTQSWTYNVKEDTKHLLQTLPEHTIAIAYDKAKKAGKEGWVLTLDFPCYYAVMSYADDRKLREEFYKAYLTRASELAEDTKFDNTALIDEILALRERKSQIIGYENYAEYSLVPKMAQKTSEVIGFLQDLVRRSKNQASNELRELEKFAKNHDKLDKMEPWDITYYSTLYQKTYYDFEEEALRPYFPEDKVFLGLFKLSERIFGIKINELKDFTKWNDTVRLFEIRDEKGELRGKFYTDLYARDYKRSGAWISGLTSRIRLSTGEIRYPTSFLQGNFTPPSSTKPALLSHNEVNTLFHEFGHTLQYLLTQVDYQAVSGINGVAWDAVELPSQFMENWCWEWDVIQDISGHYETGEKLPKDLFEKLLATKNYQSAMQMVRQLEFALFDFRIHSKIGEDKNLSVQEILNDVRSKVAVIQPTSYNRFQNGFSHIFAGGYAAGYYSYKWAEVLSSDAFAKFEETDKFNLETGLLFRKTILEQGGSRDAMDIFVEFRGRRPNIEALLRHSGIE